MLLLLQNKPFGAIRNIGWEWVFLIPSSLLLAFFSKAGNESGQASYSRILPDRSSKEGCWNSKILVNFLKDITQPWAWCSSWYDVIIHDLLKYSMGMHSRRLSGGVSRCVCQMPVLDAQGPAFSDHCGLAQSHFYPLFSMSVMFSGSWESLLLSWNTVLHAFMLCLPYTPFESGRSVSSLVHVVKLMSSFRDELSSLPCHLSPG